LLISIFILLLISVVAIALIVASGTESSLAGNYRSATGVYYAALAGLEEARGRLLKNNANSFKTTAPANFLLSPLPIGYANYVLNPSPTDNQASMLITTYLDSEYTSEFGVAPSNTSTTLSIWDSNPLKTALNLPGPLYKWVRINAVSEKSLNLLVAPSYSGPYDSTTPVYYDSTQPVGAQLNISGNGSQVLEITSLAVLPNGSQKLLQYLIAPGPIALPLFLNSAPLAALTLSGSSGNSPTFQAPGSSNTVYAVKGNDTLQGCSGSTGSPVAAIGLFGDYSGGSYAPDLSNMVGGIPASPASIRTNYTGVNPAPDVEYLSSFPANFQTPAQVDAIAQNIIQNADAVFVPAGGSSTQTAYLTSLGMSPTNLMTVIANGNLDISDWSHDGYGLLLVTGTFTYDPDTNWNGIVLVIGQGVVNNSQNGQYSQINGAMFVAKTRDTSGNLLTGRIGGASVAFLNGMQGNGIRYSSCWVPKAQPVGTYKVLSFHEIAQ
jgi:hypothetical protein